MPAGKILPSESRSFTDPATGVLVRQLTQHASIHHHPFYYLPAYNDLCTQLFFVSHRTGSPQIYLEDRKTGVLVQLTDRADLSEWSIHPAHVNPYVYFVAGTSAWRVNTETFAEEELMSFGDIPMREAGMVGAGMGTSSLSRDDKWWCVPIKTGKTFQMFILDTATGEYDACLEQDSMGHPQFHPDDNTLLRYAGKYCERIWVVNRDGSQNYLLYDRNANAKEWIVHETWIPGERAILTVNWPHGIMKINLEDRNTTMLSRFNAWHPMVNRMGTLIVTDTKNPDRGLLVFDPREPNAPVYLLCQAKSSNVGEHWNTDHCPYDDGPVKVFAPQHTHPHPNFSPDGKHVVFTSDRTGYAQVYEVALPDDLTQLPIVSV